MLNLSVADQSEASQSLRIGALAEIRVGETGLGLSSPEASNAGRMSGLLLFCHLHGLALEGPDAAARGKPARPAADQLDHALLRFRTDAGRDGLTAVTDLWFANGRQLRLRFDPLVPSLPKTAVWRIHQCDLETGTVVPLAGKTVDHGELSFLDVDLRNPFLPVLFSVSTGEGRLIATSLLPFPSLCRGGMHYAELCAASTAVDLSTDLNRLSLSLVESLLDLREGKAVPLFQEVGVLARHADDADALFSAELRAWMAWIGLRHELSVTAVDELGHPIASGSPGLPAGAASAGQPGRLDLPEMAVPTLQAFLARDGVADPLPGSRIAGFLVAETGTGDPLWNVGMPPVDGDLLSLQPVNRPRPFPLLTEGGAVPASPPRKKGKRPVGPVFPLAVKFVDRNPLGQKVSLLSPISPQISPPLLMDEKGGEEQRVTVLIPACARPEEGLKALVESLALQTMSHRLDIVAVASAEDRFEKLHAEALLERHFAGRAVVVECAPEADTAVRLDLAASRASGGYFLVADHDVVLHDARTVSTLLSMAAKEWVATAGCMLLRAGLSKREGEIVFFSAGCFPLADQGSETEEAVHALNCLDAFPLATYPVAANAPALQMVAAATVRACGGFAGGLVGGDSLSYRAGETGLIHLCTTAVSAGLRVTTAPPPNRLAVDRAVASSDLYPRSAGLRRLRG
jgi:hypothetical protein